MLSPDTPYPLEKVTKEVLFLKNFIANSNIQVGDYTYSGRLQSRIKF